MVDLFKLGSKVSKLSSTIPFKKIALFVVSIFKYKFKEKMQFRTYCSKKTEDWRSRSIAQDANRSIYKDRVFREWIEKCENKRKIFYRKVESSI